jgi:hypothetical protein
VDVSIVTWSITTGVFETWNSFGAPAAAALPKAKLAQSKATTPKTFPDIIELHDFLNAVCCFNVDRLDLYHHARGASYHVNV